MVGKAALLGVHLLRGGTAAVRAGSLTRAADGATTFTIDEAYLRDAGRPTLSLRWVSVGDEDATRVRLADRVDKIGLNGVLPPWFAGLLPEGGLRELVVQEMGAGDHDQFDLLTRLGADLPGAVVVVPETDVPDAAGPYRWDRVHGFRAPVPEGIVKFSLAGVQLKFAVDRIDGRLTAPARGGDTRFILKVPAEQYPLLPEVEFASMHLAALIGVTAAPCTLVPVGEVQGIPPELLRHGDFALAVERFDRNGAGGRTHIEDAAQIIGAVGERKYTMGTGETLLNMVKRFSGDWRDDILQGLRRIVADILLGNGDDHLKNWSFRFPDGVTPRLSPAYDIVATRLYNPRDDLALPFTGQRDPLAIGMARFGRVADFLQLPRSLVERTVADAVTRALDTWPAALADLPLRPAQSAALLSHLHATTLVRERSG